ncbi:ATP synthase F1 subunit delta [Maribacter sp. 2307ULW6-5]|uniref:ATP synthase F1 subunit delta n=1 Tax=Maribacter sp. 2307ULW6-5 TaxID=3386275 RepID=UPI0039BCE9C9
MMHSRAAVRYAKAILDLAVGQKATEKVEEDMRSVVQTVSAHQDLRDMLSSPLVAGASKKEVLSKIFKGRHAITEGLMDLMVNNRRITELQEVALRYIALNEKRKGTDVAYVTTAVPMDKALEKKILAQVERLTGNKVSLENKVDGAIIGGFVLRVGDVQYDASIANKLSNLKKEFTNSL